MEYIKGKVYVAKKSRNKFEFVKETPEGFPAFKPIDLPNFHTLTASDAEKLGDKELTGLAVFDTPNELVYQA